MLRCPAVSAICNFQDAGLLRAAGWLNSGDGANSPMRADDIPEKVRTWLEDTR